MRGGIYSHMVQLAFLSRYTMGFAQLVTIVSTTKIKQKRTKNANNPKNCFGSHKTKLKETDDTRSGHSARRSRSKSER